METYMRDTKLPWPAIDVQKIGAKEAITEYSRGYLRCQSDCAPRPGTLSFRFRKGASVSRHRSRHTARWRTFYTRKRDVKLVSGKDFSSPEANESKSSISITGRIAIEAGGVHEVEL